MTVLAMPVQGSMIHPHTGRSQEYFLVRLERGIAQGQGQWQLPADGNGAGIPNFKVKSGCLCRTNLLLELKKLGVTHLVTHHMGPRAWAKAKRLGFEVLRGNSGETSEILERFMKAGLRDEAVPCDKAHCTCGDH
jgi:predicted Fe-Mo cluster-binding NifX family protein